jgi:hypothetical protein
VTHFVPENPKFYGQVLESIRRRNKILDCFKSFGVKRERKLSAPNNTLRNNIPGTIWPAERQLNHAESFEIGESHIKKR